MRRGTSVRFIRSGARVGSLLVAVAVTISCVPPYVRVESHLVQSTRPAAAEITATPQYLEALPDIRNVAVRAPDSCANQGVAGTTGTAASRGSVVATACGVEMAEIERALTKAGYTVFSWKTIANMVDDERLTPVSAAKRLGAQVLFQVNSLERGQGTMGQDARWERQFYKSTPHGATSMPIELVDEDRTALKQFTAEGERMIVSRVRPTALLDLNAVMVDTGQSIWFYRNKKVEPIRDDIKFGALAYKKKNLWWPVEPLSHGGGSRTTTVRSGEVEAVSLPETAASEEEATYFALMREIVSDFVNQFMKGKGAPG